MSLPSSLTPTHSITHDSIDAAAEAAERRIQQEAPLQTAAQIAAEHEKRLVFRRLLDPGIMRPNPYETAMASLKTLLTIAENLLREPDNAKFQRFKPNNPTIKRHLVDPKGTLEYAVALIYDNKLGFRAEVRDFQPYYVFNPRKMADLRMGTSILKEHVDREAAKREHAERSRKDQKAMAEAAANKVKLAFFDDRKAKILHDEREKERRGALAIATQVEVTQAKGTPEARSDIPGVGNRLVDDVLMDDSVFPDEIDEDI